jgi:DNA-binding NarL/FixJ family response regulator
MKRKNQLMLIEDSPEYRETITMAVNKEDDMKLISQFGTAEEALRSLQDMSTRKVPDLILLDLNLPGITGIEAIPYFKQALPSAFIIVLTQSNHESDVLSAMSRGADGYLLKGATRRQLFTGIRDVIGGGALIDPKVANYILNRLPSIPNATDPGRALSERELEVLMLLGEGFVQKEISEKLGISANTVATHIRRVYDKLGVQNAPAAITKAYKKGILPPAY